MQHHVHSAIPAAESQLKDQDCNTYFPSSCPIQPLLFCLPPNKTINVAHGLASLDHGKL